VDEHAPIEQPGQIGVAQRVHVEDEDDITARVEHLDQTG
jgi:hypothetical protein